MKKLFLIIALAALTASGLSAQTVKYKELKQTYDYRDYVKQEADPYQTFWSGFASFFIPGVSQLQMRETGRGWIFLGTSIALDIVAQNFVDNLNELVVRDSNGQIAFDEDGLINFTDNNAARKNMMGAAITGLVQLGVAIWSSCDAVRVAKVKNMHYQDSRKFSFDTKIYPSVNFVSTPSGLEPTAGMTLALQF